MKKIINLILKNDFFNLIMFIITLYLIYSIFKITFGILSMKIFITNFIINVFIILVTLTIYYYLHKNKIKTTLWRVYKSYKIDQYLTLTFGLSLIILINSYSIFNYNDDYFLRFYDFRFRDFENNTPGNILAFFQNKGLIYTIIYLVQFILLFLPVLFLVKVIYLYFNYKKIGFDEDTYRIRYLYKSNKLHIFKIESCNESFEVFGYYDNSKEIPVEKIENIINKETPAFLENFFRNKCIKINGKYICLNSFRIKYDNYDSDYDITFLNDNYENISMFCKYKNISTDVFYNRFNEVYVEKS